MTTKTALNWWPSCLSRPMAVQAAAWGCMSRMEVLCLVWKDEGERKSRLADVQWPSLPIHWVACRDVPLVDGCRADGR
jgi:hypothetical protein